MLILISAAYFISTFGLDAKAQQLRIEYVYPNATVRITHDGKTPQIRIRRSYSNVEFEMRSNGYSSQQDIRVTVRADYRAQFEKPISKNFALPQPDSTFTASLIIVPESSSGRAVPAAPGAQGWPTSRPSWQPYMAFRPAYWPAHW
jgi:hypothetical protein